MNDAREPRWPVAAGLLVGAGFVLIGIRALLETTGDTRPPATATWIVGLALAHDFVLVPVVIAVGAALRRFAPSTVRAWLGAGLLISGSVGLVAWPLVRGYGRLATNPSILPRDYAKGTALTLVVVWSLLTLEVLRRRLSRRRGPEGITP